MDNTEDDNEVAPMEEQDDAPMFMWTPVEYDASLQAEGLLGLEVLQDDSVEPVPKKQRKSKKASEGTAQESPSLPEVSDDQVNEATRGWNNILFDQWAIPIGIRRNLYGANMTSPTVIQRLVFKPSLTAGMHIVACAETGSGKTLAFSLPIALSLKCSDEKPVSALAILPTRELALQVKDTMSMLIKGTQHSVFAIIGGMSIQKQERVLKHQPEVIVATPGRLWDIMQDVSITFKLQYLVLDEADRLVSEQSFKELGNIVDKVRERDTQCFIYSATILNREKDLQALFKLLKLSNPMVCTASHKGDLVLPYDQFIKKRPFKKTVEEDTSNTTLPPNLRFRIIKCLDDERELKLIAYMMEHHVNNDSAHIIIFVNSISYAYRLEPLLSLIFWRDKHELRIAKKHCMTLNKEPKFNFITSIHSRLKQKQRLKRLEQFTKNKKAVLICTDVAARGVDIPNITEVIHFQVPRNASTFVHRSGRTARCEAAGTAVCICESSEVDTWNDLFKAINKNMATEEVAMACIPPKQYQRYKRLLALASDIEEQEHKISKKEKTKAWLQMAAKQADIELSDEESDTDAMKARTYRSLKAGKRTLMELRDAMYD
ncbi:DEAD/DEAH box helicase family protein [Babesia bovis T2Bo]|uniref:DEAD/DEAH box helicase family protein n=1 Tax=Babesia bovis T2Bo TaxID=484906 RepID=UPI001DBC6EEF|nr:DEAD/DEAH box helicase family protein [Babesia bovis T2Bo]EDO05717.2 DEAD/DEAH box helicase family protein [Babesia bovis T2Bo]